MKLVNDKQEKLRIGVVSYNKEEKKMVKEGELIKPSQDKHNQIYGEEVHWQVHSVLGVPPIDNMNVNTPMPKPCNDRSN